MPVIFIHCHSHSSSPQNSISGHSPLLLLLLLLLLFRDRKPLRGELEPTYAFILIIWSSTSRRQRHHSRIIKNHRAWEVDICVCVWWRCGGTMEFSAFYVAELAKRSCCSASGLLKPYEANRWVTEVALSQLSHFKDIQKSVNLVNLLWILVNLFRAKKVVNRALLLWYPTESKKNAKVRPAN